MTPTDAEIIRYMAGRMGWTLHPNEDDPDCQPEWRDGSGSFMHYGPDGNATGWNPLSDLNHCREVEETVIPGNCGAYTDALRKQVGINYPIGSFGNADLLLIAMATARQRCMALWEMREK